jgi:hypothetical protein
MFWFKLSIFHFYLSMFWFKLSITGVQKSIFLFPNLKKMAQNRSRDGRRPDRRSAAKRWLEAGRTASPFPARTFFLSIRCFDR